MMATAEVRERREVRARVNCILMAGLDLNDGLEGGVGIKGRTEEGEEARVIVVAGCWMMKTEGRPVLYTYSSIAIRRQNDDISNPLLPLFPRSQDSLHQTIPLPNIPIDLPPSVSPSSPIHTPHPLHSTRPLSYPPSYASRPSVISRLTIQSSLNTAIPFPPYTPISARQALLRFLFRALVCRFKPMASRRGNSAMGYGCGSAVG